MKKSQILRFFRILDQRLDRSATVILIGASAGSLMGHIRPSMDIDFEIRLRRPSRAAREVLQQAIQEAVEKVKVAVNYSDNIGNWSQISYLNYRGTATFYKKIGKLEIKLVAPEFWTLGKMARGLELDLCDITAIIRKKKLKPKPLIRLWARALRQSPLSLELGQFKRHVLDFLKERSRKAWGAKSEPERLTAFFLTELAKGS